VRFFLHPLWIRWKGDEIDLDAALGMRSIIVSGSRSADAGRSIILVGSERAGDAIGSALSSHGYSKKKCGVGLHASRVIQKNDRNGNDQQNM
jgi:hypothetical protein